MSIFNQTLLAVALGFLPVLTIAQSAPKAAGDTSVQFSGNRAVFTQQGGETLYRTICQGCHMPQGQGARGAGYYPALANNPRLASAAYPLYVVVNGLHGMPSFEQRLDDQQVVDVVNFVRANFGNTYTDAAKPADVSAIRPKK